jgi:hypothetical protein
MRILASQKNSRRGKARADAQLSKLQRRMLEEIFNHVGPNPFTWSAKKFIADTNVTSTPQTISASLASLVRRGLLLKSGFHPNIQVRLTQDGLKAAMFEIEHKQTPRQRFDAEQLKLARWLQERDDI